MMNWLKKVNAIQEIDTSDLVKKSWLKHKTWWNWKKNTDQNHSNNYMTNQDFDTLLADNFADTLKQKNLASQNDIADFVKKHILMIS